MRGSEIRVPMHVNGIGFSEISLHCTGSGCARFLPSCEAISNVISTGITSPRRSATRARRGSKRGLHKLHMCIVAAPIHEHEQMLWSGIVVGAQIVEKEPGVLFERVVGSERKEIAL